MAIETRDVIGKEICREGKFEGGKELTSKHLDDFMDNFQQSPNEPYLNLDHDERFTEKIKDALKVARLGTVSKLYRKGASLYADFKNVPAKIADLIESGVIGQRSIEFYRELTREGKKYNNVLHAVSFFGKDLPAIPNLGDYVPSLYAESNTDEIERVTNYGAEMVKESEKEVCPMDELQIYKDQITTLKSEVETLKAEKAELVNRANSLESDNKSLKAKSEEFETYKAEVAKAAETALAAEAEKYVSDQVQAKKILPAYKEDYKADYIAKSKESPERLERFRKEIEARAELMPTQLKDDGSDGQVEYSKALLANTDLMAEAIEAHMAKFKITDWEKARVEVFAKIQEKE